MTIKEIKQQIKGIFKQPVRELYLGKVQFGCPYFYPWNWNKTIIEVRKEIPKYRPNPIQFKIFNNYVFIGSPIWFSKCDLGWKDKFDSPRHEWNPQWQLLFFGWELHCWWVSPIDENNQYWEQILRYISYSNKDIIKAEKEWGWTNMTTKESTWNKNYLI